MSRFRIHNDRIEVRLPTDLKHEFELLALGRNMSSSTLIREMMERELEERRKALGVYEKHLARRDAKARKLLEGENG